MQRTLEHIEAFTRFMNGKGYQGNFHSSFGFYDALRDNLIKHVFQCYEEKKTIGPLNLTTYSHWTDSKNPYVRCNFYTDYSEPAGFNILKMNIEHGNENGPLRSVEIPIRRNADIPDRDHAKLMVTEKKRGMKI